MTTERATAIEMIPIDQILVVNSRVRGKVKFQQIVDNIATLGLKKPVTVTPRRNRNGGPQYDLVCGQGRLEAFQALGQREVPAFVVDVSKDEAMLMSLTENLARRRRMAHELMASIATLKDQGYKYADIATKTGLTADYVKDVIRLLSKGEERLLRAVEMGQIPITIAVTIATSDDAAIQRALADAYTEKSLRGKGMIRARRLIDQRHARGKRLNGAGSRREVALDGESVLRTYKEETIRQRTLIRQATQCETKLMIAAHNFSVSYAKCLVAATARKDLVDQSSPKEVKGLTPEDVARIEREMQPLESDFRRIEKAHGQNLLNLVVAAGYVKRLLNNAAVVKYLSRKYPDLLPELERIVETTDLTDASREKAAAATVSPPPERPGTRTATPAGPAAP